MVQAKRFFANEEPYHNSYGLDRFVQQVIMGPGGLYDSHGNLLSEHLSGMIRQHEAMKENNVMYQDV